jgi:methionyl-tRNA formyltransferase
MENQIRIAVLCGGPFAGPALMKLAMENYLCGIAIGTRDYKMAEQFRTQCEQAGLSFSHIGYKEDVSLIDAWLDEVKPDAVFSICFPYRLSAEILQKIPDGFYNFHPGPLPSYRGPSPIFEVIKRASTTTAVSVHRMQEEYDTGDLLFAEQVTVEKTDNYVSLAQKLSQRSGLAAMALAEMLQFSSRIPAVPQSSAGAAFYPFPGVQDMTIGWETMDAQQIIALINACNGWTRGAITRFGEEIMRVTTVGQEPQSTEIQFPPGTILEISENNHYAIACLNKQAIVIGPFSSDFGDLGMNYYESAGIRKGVQLGK